MSQPPARVERDGPLATIVIDHPPLNLFGEPLLRSLEQAVDDVERSDARALAIVARGDVFTGGADVNSFQGLDVADGAQALGAGLELIRRVEALPMPTLSVVHALCLTAGFELSLACDLIWAAEGVPFGLVEAVIGLTPGWGGNQRLVERAGPARAKELIMSAGLFTSETLERWNVVNRVLPAAELNDKAMRFAMRLAQGPTLAHAATKQLARSVRDGGVDEADRRTLEIIGALFETEDLRAGIESFLSEGPGKASFQGR
ncbi:MAG: enoyl-CoA hydratase/isomerase family protein [Solirubrobacterales bacterium]